MFLPHFSARSLVERSRLALVLQPKPVTPLVTSARSISTDIAKIDYEGSAII